MKGGGGGAIRLGDLIWVNLNHSSSSSSSWWPAQVVDANSVSDTIKPTHRSVGELLVRLYGSYDYLFVDPIKSRFEFELVRKKNHGSHCEIFHKSLERDRPGNNFFGSKEQSSMSIVGAIPASKLKQNLLKHRQESIASESRIVLSEGDPEISDRLTRVRKRSFVTENLGSDVSDDEEITQPIYLHMVSPKRILSGNASLPMVKDGVVVLDSMEESVILKTAKLDLSKKKHSFEDTMISKCLKQNKVQKKLILNSPSNKEAKSSRIPERDELPMKFKSSTMTPIAVPTSSVNSREWSGGVKHSLGVVASSESLQFKKPPVRSRRSYPF